MRILSVALMIASAASAQVTSPLLGWLPDGTRIRPMNGLPAAAILGRPVNIGHAITHPAISPNQNYVLASDASTGEVLLIIPSVSATVLNVPMKPDQTIASPQGSSAALWYSATAQLGVISGLPGAPAIRLIDGSVLGASPVAIAVSDDGQWIAAASAAGVYMWGGSGVQEIYSGGDAAALAFFAGSSNLAVGTSTQILEVSGSATSVLYQGAVSPVGLATSFNNQKIVLADQSGTIYSIDATTQVASTNDCQCRPSGVFGLDGSVFRLTSSSVGAIKIFDAAAGAVLAVPGDAVKTTRVVRRAQTSGPLPNLTVRFTPTPTGYLQQPTLTITASSAYPTEIDGTVALLFSSTSTTGGQDQTIQFSSGGPTVNFTIPAGSTQANFSGAPSITFSTGTSCGYITASVNLTAPTAATAVTSLTVQLLATTPVITGVTLSQVSGGVNVVVTGYSPTDDVTSGIFNFALTSNASLTVNDLEVSLSPEFQTYYGSSSSYATGSEFTLTVPFTVTGNATDMVGVTVTLLNSIAAGAPVSSQ